MRPDTKGSPMAGRTATPAALAIALVATCLLALALASPASASKRVIDYFGTSPSVGEGTLGGEFRNMGGIAVNQTGAGAGNPGDIYVVDAGTGAVPPTDRNHRIQRFGRDDNGTPNNPYDDTYFFISAWGADVVQPDGTGDAGDAADANYEICTVAAECKAGVASGGNGTPAGNGVLNNPQRIAVDQDTGYVYVTDSRNNRVNVYEGDGTFLRSFGFDVVAQGPGKAAAPDEQQELTVTADGGKFSLAFRGETSGARGTGRLDQSNVVNQVQTTAGAFEVGQQFAAYRTGNSAYPLGTTITAVGSTTLTLSTGGFFGPGDPNPLFGDDLDFDLPATELEEKLNSLPTIGGIGGEVTVSGGPGDPTGSSPYVIEFGGALGGEDVPEIVPHEGNLTLGGDGGSADVETLVEGGAFEVCVAADGDVCKAGSPGSAPGQLGNTQFNTGSHGIAISQPDGDPATGTVFVADNINRRINTYELDGTRIGSFGSPSEFGSGWPRRVAVDSRGIVYATDGAGFNKVQRYDTEDSNGEGVGFLDPITGPVNEIQEVTIAATAGQFRLSFDGDETVDIPFDAPRAEVRDALQDLPSIGEGNVVVADGPDADGLKPYRINFTGALSAQDVSELVASNGTIPLSGGTGAGVTTVRDGADGVLGLGTLQGLTIDPDADGAGTDALYVGLSGGGDTGRVQQLGPLNEPGLTAQPAALDEEHGIGQFSGSNVGVALDQTGGRKIYVPSSNGAGQQAFGVYVLHEAGPAPTASLDSFTDITATTATVHATVNPNGPPPVSYRVQYSLDGSQWTSLPATVLGVQTEPQAIEVVLDPPPVGLDPDTEYHVRIEAIKAFAEPVISNEATFTTLPEAPRVETTGAPVRTATTAELTGRVNPRGAATSFHFEYGSEGPCESNPCESTPAGAVGSGNLVRLVAAEATGLEPATTYHYRVVADNGNPGSPSHGEEMTVRTRASDAPLQSDLPGPHGSDRAWEQVSVPETGGNPVFGAMGIADEGERVVYQLPGGTPIGDTGSAFNQFLAERTAGGWEQRTILPPRSELVGPNWLPPFGSRDLSVLSVPNHNVTSGETTFWRLGPDAPPARLLDTTPAEYGSLFMASADGSRHAVLLDGDHDPGHDAPPLQQHLYDISSGNPRLVSLLPSGAPPACGVRTGQNVFSLPENFSRATDGWISPDGSTVFFPSFGNNCGGRSQLYARDVEADETTLVSGPALSGQLCDAAFVKATPGAVFFWTQSRLDPADSEPASCTGTAGGDVYRFDLGDGEVECVTCAVEGLAADVRSPTGGGTPPAFIDIAVAEDGSRIYFESPRQLAAGAASPGIYRVEVESGELAYVAPASGGARAGDHLALGNFLTPDGSVFVLRSSSGQLNPVGGSDNGGTNQLYRYDDRDRSLVCVSCPQDGSPASHPVGALSIGGQFEENGPNVAPISDDDVVAFATPLALVPADQNTAGPGQDPAAGTDVYEWRDGRVLLVTDGISEWPNETLAPRPNGVSASGRDVFFTASAQLTPDAPDAFQRLYVARIGGGFEFEGPEPPCPLEACQGDPAPAPQNPSPGSIDVEGEGNPQPDGDPRSCEGIANRATRQARRASTLGQRARSLRQRARRQARRGSARRARALRARAGRVGRRARSSRQRAQALRREARECRAEARR